MSTASIENAVQSLLNSCYNCTTVVFHYGWGGLAHFIDALYIQHTICRNIEIFRNHMVSVAPSVVGAVDLVSIDEGGIAAAVGEGRGVGARDECHSGTAVGDGRQGGDVYLGEAVNRGGVIVSGREAFRVQCVSVGPDGIVSCAVGVAVAEYNRSGTVAVKACGAIHKHRSDGVATDISDGVCRRTCHIHQTSYGRAIISRHIGDDFRQSNVIGECPIPTMSCTVGESVGIYNVALATVETAVVHRRFGSCKRVAASVGDGRHYDLVGSGLGKAVDCSLSVFCGDGEVLRGNVISICPRVVGVVDNIGVGVNGVAAGRIMIE